MTKKYSKYGAVGFNAKASQINQLIQKLPDDKQHTLYQELKSSGSIDNPVKYTETHLEGGIEDEI